MSTYTNLPVNHIIDEFDDLSDRLSHIQTLVIFLNSENFFECGESTVKNYFWMLQQMTNETFKQFESLLEQCKQAISPFSTPVASSVAE